MNFIEAQKKIIEAQKFYNNGKYSNAFIGNVSGTAVSMDDVSPLEHKIPVKLSSKNLIPYPWKQTSKTEKGLTFTDNGNGTLTIDGTATAEGSFVFYENSTIAVDETYTLSGIVGGDSTGRSLYYLQLYVDGSSKMFVADGSITTELKGNISRIVLFYKIGAVFDNYILKPQLEKGTVATPWTPYVPNDTAVTVRSYRKNLFDRTKEDVINGELYNSQNYIQHFYLKPNTKYTFSTSVPMANEGVQANIYFNGNSTPVAGCWNGQARTATTDENGYLYMLFSIHNIDTIFSPSYFMQLEEASEATAYEPFIGETIIITPAEGAELTSIAPNMTIMTDTSGLILSAEYTKDTEKVLDEITDVSETQLDQMLEEVFI